MTAERIASYITGLGFHADHTDSSVKVTLSSAVPLTLDLDVAKRGLAPKEFSDAASKFAAGLEEGSLYAETVRNRLGMDPADISNLDLEDFMEVMESGQLEQARRDVREGVASARSLARSAKKLAARIVPIPARAGEDLLSATA